MVCPPRGGARPLPRRHRLAVHRERRARDPEGHPVSEPSRWTPTASHQALIRCSREHCSSRSPFPPPRDGLSVPLCLPRMGTTSDPRSLHRFDRGRQKTAHHRSASIPAARRRVQRTSRYTTASVAGDSRYANPGLTDPKACHSRTALPLLRLQPSTIHLLRTARPGGRSVRWGFRCPAAAILHWISGFDAARPFIAPTQGSVDSPAHLPSPSGPCTHSDTSLGRMIRSPSPARKPARSTVITPSLAHAWGGARAAQDVKAADSEVRDPRSDARRWCSPVRAPSPRAGPLAARHGAARPTVASTADWSTMLLGLLAASDPLGEGSRSAFRPHPKVWSRCSPLTIASADQRTARSALPHPSPVRRTPDRKSCDRQMASGLVLRGADPDRSMSGASTA